MQAFNTDTLIFRGRNPPVSLVVCHVAVLPSPSIISCLDYVDSLFCEDFGSKRAPRRHRHDLSGFGILSPVFIRQVCEAECAGSSYFGLQYGREVSPDFIVVKRKKRIVMEKTLEEKYFMPLVTLPFAATRLTSTVVCHKPMRDPTHLDASAKNKPSRNPAVRFEEYSSIDGASQSIEGELQYVLCFTEHRFHVFV